MRKEKTVIHTRNQKIIWQHLFVTGCLLLTGCAGQTEIRGPNKIPKNIIIMFTDGTGTGELETARQYNRYRHERGFYITDQLMRTAQIGLMSNDSSDSLVTDSAAAATAMSTGHKTMNGHVGVDASGKPLENIGELAKRQGKTVAIASNANILDASPAAFSGGHTNNRKDYFRIAEQYSGRGFAMLLGGGRDYFLPKEQGGKRDDRQDLVSRFRDDGYAYAEDRAGLAQLTGTRILGLFAKDNFPMETERDPQQTPSLAEMTDKILSLLASDSNPQGFFAFIENELTDSAGHTSDAANMLLHTLDFDQAVQVAHAFQIKHPETLLIIATDHDTGAFSLSLASRGVTREDAKVRTYPTRVDFDKISQVHVSMEKVAEELGKTPSGELLDRVMARHFPGFTLDADLREKILKRETLSRTHTYPVVSVLGEMVARHTHMFWGTSGHTNAWPFVISVGPGAERFAGFLDNTTFGKNLSGLLHEK